MTTTALAAVATTDPAWRVRLSQRERCQGALRDGSPCRNRATALYEWPRMSTPLCAIHGRRLAPIGKDRSGLLNEVRYPPTGRELRESQLLHLPVHALRAMSARAILSECRCRCGDPWCDRKSPQWMQQRRWDEVLSDAERDALGYRP